MRCSTTAILLAVATTARFIPRRCPAILIPQAFSHDHFTTRVSSDLSRLEQDPAQHRIAAPV